MIAIDPGRSGGVAARYPDGRINAWPMPAEDADALDLLRGIVAAARTESWGIEATMEKVGGYVGGTGQPGSAMFTFGASYGFLLGVLMALEVPLVLVRPQQWQAALQLGKATAHASKPAWKRLGPQVAAALRNSDVLALEIDPADPTLVAELADLQPIALPPALQTRLTQAYERACVAPESLSSLHPVLQATTLTVLEARWLSLDPGYALEQVLATQARANGRRVLSLETAAQQKAALVPSDPAEALSSLDQSLAQLEDGSGRRVLQRMAQAWESGDLATLEDFDRWCECVATEADRAFMRKLNDERNPGLAARIEAQHRRGQRVFAAVGALHMTGPQSLPRLLTQRGFKVERVAFVP